MGQHADMMGMSVVEKSFLCCTVIVAVCVHRKFFYTVTPLVDCNVDNQGAKSYLNVTSTRRSSDKSFTCKCMNDSKNM